MNAKKTDLRMHFPLARSAGLFPLSWPTDILRFKPLPLFCSHLPIATYLPTDRSSINAPFSSAVLSLSPLRFNYIQCLFSLKRFWQRFSSKISPDEGMKVLKTRVG